MTETALEKNIQVGYSFGRLAYEFHDMPSVITWGNIGRLRPDAIDMDPEGLAAAHQLTEDRIKLATPNR